MVKRFLPQLATTVLFASILATANAASYPDKAITVITPFPAGGATDTLARVVTDSMGEHLGEALVVDNRPGATTNIGASYVMRSKPDGYTIFLATNSTLVTNRYLYKDLPYDPDGFAPIGMIGIGPMILLSSKQNDFSSLEEIVDAAKRKPGELTIASFGSGTSSHLAAEYFQKVADIDLLHIPFKGSTEALPQMVNGDIDLFFDMISTGMPQVKGDKVNVTNITSLERASSLPDLPTIAEEGYPDFEMTAWFTLVAPPETPEEITAVLREALQKTLAEEEVQASMQTMGIEPSDGAADTLLDQIEKEKPIIQELVDRADITVQ